MSWYGYPKSLRLMRRQEIACDPVTEIHCWIARFADGHEEIILYIDKARVGPSMRREPLEGQEAAIWNGYGSRQPKPVSIRLASFYERSRST
jgi:hypothetical protein